MSKGILQFAEARLLTGDEKKQEHCHDKLLQMRVNQVVNFVVLISNGKYIDQKATFTII